MDHDWRSNTILQLDNAKCHKSEDITNKFISFQIPIFYSGPYSYDAHAAEKIFASIKGRDLNPNNRCFVNR